MPGMERPLELDHRGARPATAGQGGRNRGHGGLSGVPPDASFVSGQASAVDGGYTAGRDHGVVQLFGFPE